MKFIYKPHVILSLILVTSIFVGTQCTSNQPDRTHSKLSSAIEKKVEPTQGFQPNLFPSSDPQQTFLRVNEIETYDPSTLFSKINGGSEVFVGNGMTSLHVARYQKPTAQDEKFDVYVYQFQDAFGAFGTFKVNTKECMNLPIGHFGCEQKGSWKIVQNSCYIDIVSFSTSPVNPSVWSSIVTQILNPVSKENPVEKMIQYFPKDNLLNNSIGFTNKAYKGFDFLNRAFFASYSASGSTKDQVYEVFLIKDESAKNNAWKGIQDYIKQEKKALEVVKSALPCVKTSLMDAITLLITQNDYIMGILAIQDVSQGISLLNQMGTLIAANQTK